MNAPRVYGLTFHRPWPWAIFHANRPVESRSWFPPVKMLPPGCWFAVHAGQKWDERAQEFISARHGHQPPPRERHASGQIVGGVQFLGAFELGTFNQGKKLLKLTRGDVMRQTAILRWASMDHGRVVWVLGDRVLFVRPIIASGSTGLWRLEAADEVEFLARLRAGG